MKATIASYTGSQVSRPIRVETHDIEITDAGSASEFSSNIEISNVRWSNMVFGGLTVRLQRRIRKPRFFVRHLE